VQRGRGLGGRPRRGVLPASWRFAPGAARAPALFVGMKGESPAKFTPRKRTRELSAMKCPFVSAATRLVVIGEFRPEKSVTEGVESFHGKIKGMFCAPAMPWPKTNAANARPGIHLRRNGWRDEEHIMLGEAYTKITNAESPSYNLSGRP